MKGALPQAGVQTLLVSPLHSREDGWSTQAIAGLQLFGGQTATLCRMGRVGEIRSMDMRSGRGLGHWRALQRTYKGNQPHERRRPSLGHGCLCNEDQESYSWVRKSYKVTEGFLGSEKRLEKRSTRCPHTQNADLLLSHRK